MVSAPRASSKRRSNSYGAADVGIIALDDGGEHASSGDLLEVRMISPNLTATGVARLLPHHLNSSLPGASHTSSLTLASAASSTLFPLSILLPFLGVDIGFSLDHSSAGTGSHHTQYPWQAAFEVYLVSSRIVLSGRHTFIGVTAYGQGSGEAYARPP